MAQGSTRAVPIDIDPLLANNSDLLVPSQKAVKTYIDSITVNGYTITIQSGVYSVTATSGTLIVLCNTGSSSFSVNLPTAAGNQATIIIKKIASNNILTVSTSLSQTIDGGSTAQLKVQYASITLVSDGANWQIV